MTDRRRFRLQWLRDRICAAWNPPRGEAGRDTHICGLPRKHAGFQHECKCGANW